MSYRQRPFGMSDSAWIGHLNEQHRRDIAANTEPTADALGERMNTHTDENGRIWREVKPARQPICCSCKNPNPKQMSDFTFACQNCHFYVGYCGPNGCDVAHDGRCWKPGDNAPLSIPPNYFDYARFNSQFSYPKPGRTSISAGYSLPATAEDIQDVVRFTRSALRAPEPSNLCHGTISGHQVLPRHED